MECRRYWCERHTEKNLTHTNYFSNLLKDVECVIVILSAVSHGTMYAVKDVADKFGIKVVYHRSKGISSVINAVHENVAFY
ncbi:DUF2325 domain-containing protein [Oceanobacillus caeni]|uniref:DUF2325 domain-containing protein n=1 Tax=Oceanobacillus caeni TaxID=405946 RepID=UPI00399C60D7